MKKNLLLVGSLLMTLSSVNSFAQSISGGAQHSFALCSDSTIRAWGYNVYGQLGNGSNTSSNVPVQVSALQEIIAVAGLWQHSLALKNDRTVWAWGANSVGQLGN